MAAQLILASLAARKSIKSFFGLKKGTAAITASDCAISKARVVGHAPHVPPYQTQTRSGGTT